VESAILVVGLQAEALPKGEDFANQQMVIGRFSSLFDALLISYLSFIFSLVSLRRSFSMVV
jgi:hypothetical protein